MRAHQNAPDPEKTMLQQPPNHTAMLDGDIRATQLHGRAGKFLQCFARALYATIRMPLH